VAGARFVGVRPVPFVRPYYAFRPRFSIGFGFWAGYPVGYPYAYYPYYYPYPYYGYPYPYAPYGYPYPVGAPGYAPPPAGSVAVEPGQAAANTGGLSFEITPATAEVFVDGADVGTVAQFTPTLQPLPLAPGRHHVEIRAAGYRTIEFDADIVAGQVIPYRGTMQR
jgi:hypothetical protein